MTGAAAQTLDGTVQTAFNNLTINNGAGVSLGVNKSGSGVLNLTSGNLNTGAFTYELTASGSITRTNGQVLALAESLLKSENGGAVAVWTSTGMTGPDEQLVLNKQLYQLLLQAAT